MKCIKCSKSAVTGLKHLGPLCNKCFLRAIEKRIRKDLSVNKVFSPHDRVLVVNDGSLKAELSLYFINSISKDIPLKIDISDIKQNVLKNSSFDKVVVAANMDNLIGSFLDSLFTGKEFVFPNQVYLLRSVSDEECLVLKQILMIDKNLFKSGLGKKLDLLEKKYPGSKFGLFRFLMSRYHNNISVEK